MLYFLKYSISCTLFNNFCTNLFRIPRSFVQINGKTTWTHLHEYNTTFNLYCPMTVKWLLLSSFLHSTPCFSQKAFGLRANSELLILLRSDWIIQWCWSLPSRIWCYLKLLVCIFKFFTHFLINLVFSYLSVLLFILSSCNCGWVYSEDQLWDNGLVYLAENFQGIKVFRLLHKNYRLFLIIIIVKISIQKNKTRRLQNLQVRDCSKKSYM